MYRGSQLLGLAVGRYILCIPAITGMADETLIEWLRPVLTHYLTGHAPEKPRLPGWAFSAVVRAPSTVNQVYSTN